MAANVTFLPDPADGRYDDWFELFNPNDVAVNLSGYSLTDDLVAGARWTVPAGTTIPANGFLLVWADNETIENSTNSTDLHAGFRLSQSGEAIGLFAPNGSLVDSVTFGPQTNDISRGRWPDGSASFYFMPIPTPRRPNVIPTAPGEIRIVGTGVAGNGDVTIAWTSEPGVIYRVQFKNALDAATWSDLRDITATGSLTSIIDVVAGVPQRFYRITRVGP